MGDGPGTATIRVHDFTKNEPAGGLARIETTEPAAPGTTGYEEIEVSSIDALVPADRQVSVIHMDLEGFEKKALAGARQTILRCRPFLAIEGRIGAAWMNEMLGEEAYVAASHFEKNQFFLPLPA